MAYLNFSNVSKNKTGFQLKLKKNRKEYQPHFYGHSDIALHEALLCRNKLYKSLDYVHRHYMITLCKPSELHADGGKVEGISRLKDSRRINSEYFQFAIRKLENRALTYKKVFISTFDSEQDALEYSVKFRNQWVSCYNRIATIYNKKRKAQFIRNAKLEAELLEPSIHEDAPFDKYLWQDISISLYGETLDQENPFVAKPKKKKRQHHYPA